VVIKRLVMSQEIKIVQLKKVRFAKATEVCADTVLSDEALMLINETSTPPEYLEQLISAKHYQDAIKFLARSLPSREAAWWACVSARNGVDENTAANEAKALELAEQWVFKPTDENRHIAHDAVASLENDSSIHWVGMAVLWSGGSMAPPDVPHVPTAPNMCGMAVSGAVMLAGLSDDVEESARRYELFLKQGIAIANGSNAKDVV
jgi:hypothetical protein